MVASGTTIDFLIYIRDAACRSGTVGAYVYRKEITYTLQPRFCKVDYRSVNVQCPNSTQDNTILMMVLEAVM